ncbi:hypothetical protein [Nocardia sp. NPDC052566]|uniref:hypothetical protein n=1 Tax=Nocardia sp. NPDC052566 TaxID=3364330 RepID=UPI0037C4F8D6
MSSPDDDVPAWQRRTDGESRIMATAAVIVLIGLQFVLPRNFLPDPMWVLPALETLLLVVLVIATPVRIPRNEKWLRAIVNSARITREDKWLRVAGLVLIGLLSLATVWSADRLVLGLIDGTLSDDPARLLGSGGAVWLTNVGVFALWYWEFDRGGPAARANARKPLPDFLFVQMQNPELAPREWEPEFVDYLYLSFTNATAFSPTDVMPMSRWAKAAMMLQSAVSLILVVLVIARAINVLK